MLRAAIRGDALRRTEAQRPAVGLLGIPDEKLTGHFFGRLQVREHRPKSGNAKLQTSELGLVRLVGAGEDLDEALLE